MSAGDLARLRELAADSTLSLRGIAAKLGVSHETVRTYLKSEQIPYTYERAERVEETSAYGDEPGRIFDIVDGSPEQEIGEVSSSGGLDGAVTLSAADGDTHHTAVDSSATQDDVELDLADDSAEATNASVEFGPSAPSSQAPLLHRIEVEPPSTARFTERRDEQSESSVTNAAGITSGWDIQLADPQPRPIAGQHKSTTAHAGMRIWHSLKSQSKRLKNESVRKKSVCLLIC
jgi:hypothetical protein